MQRFSPEQVSLMLGYFCIHEGIRKDMQRLEQMAAQMGKWPAERRKQALEWFVFHKVQIEQHHHGEDEHFTPLLSKTIPDMAVIMEKMAADHKVLDEKMHRLEKALRDTVMDTTTAPALRQAVQEYRDVVLRHLEEEEDLVVPQVCSHFTPQTFEKLEQEYLKTIPRDVLSGQLPWILDAVSEAHQREFLAKLPFLVRLLYRMSMRKKYARRIAFLA